jgi:ApbE superfamily uncharacterized protein (UPF0280 family)
MTRAQIALLPDGRRLHLQDGPIDLIVEAWGGRADVETAYRAAADRFVTILDELCAELPLLRRAADPDRRELTGVVARRMQDAVVPFASDIFITPMAAVAGAVAEEVLEAMTAAAPLARAYVNTGGDIALHLAPGEIFKIAMIDRPDRPSLFGTATIAAQDPVRGIATSGWRGRSFSLGIADAVTALAPTAAMADAAATVIANAVDLPGHPGILRVPATDLQPDSDLGRHLVTRHVPELTRGQVATALDAGEAAALSLQARKLITAAALHLQGQTRLAGAIAASIPDPIPAKAIAHA